MSAYRRSLLMLVPASEPERRLLSERFHAQFETDPEAASELAARMDFDVVVAGNCTDWSWLRGIATETTQIYLLGRPDGDLPPGVQHVERVSLLESLLASRSPAGDWRRLLVGESQAIRRVCATIELVARRKCTVLITGETGTGKEVVARAIHMASDRAESPMVAVNCAAIPEHLLEAELFGHTKGAFTGAAGPRTGLFERAHNGTLFLDEVGEMPLELQAKLLRVLQEREFLKIGSSTPQKVDVRVLAASNVDLAKAVREKGFRADLYYRLNVVPVHLPALRERPSDIPLLVEHLMAKICVREGMETKTLTPDALRRLEACEWPGNVRELEHTLEMAAMMSGDRRVLGVADFPGIESLGGSSGGASLRGVQIPEGGLDFESVMTHIQRTLLSQALEMSGGNKARAAELLGMKRTTLLTKVKALSHCAR